MVNIYYKANDKLQKESDLYKLSQIDLRSLVWIDLFDLDEVEKHYVSSRFRINLYDKQQLEEIETSSRYFENSKIIVANSNFLIQTEGTYFSEPASFILRNNYLITYRNHNFRTFGEVIRKLENNPKQYPSGYHILLSILETRIDFDADLLESIAREISKIGVNLVNDDKLDQDIIYSIATYQETTMLIRQNIIDKQRMVSSLLRSEYFPREYTDKLRIIIKDINSLVEHSNFNFERLEYLQDTFMGIVNIEQNKIIKIFTVASVVFMPPTLIASIYGMNFSKMPELNWSYGYLFAIGVMILSSIFTLYLFKRKNWL